MKSGDERHDGERSVSTAGEPQSDTAHEGGGMAMRGVTRPMAERQLRQHQKTDGQGEANEKDDAGKESHEEMTREQRLEMLRMHHKQTLWVYWMLVLLGVWMVVAPFTFGYGNEALWVQPSGGRGVWFGEGLHTGLRATLMTWSDVLSGLLLIVFGWRALKPNRPVSLWICCFVGIWLSFAPFVFWSPSAAAYLNDSLVGLLVIALAVLIPGMPNMILYMRMGPPTPPGWSYNPSS